MTATISFLRKTFAIERLPPPPAPPQDASPERAGLGRLLFRVEPLPRDPELPAVARAGWLELLLRPEPLPRDPPLPPRRRRARSLLSALLAPERLDPP